MNVIHMPLPIIAAPDCVLPETSLPDVALAPMIGCRCNSTRACLLDFAPAPREVGIAFRQLQDAMQVIGQDDDPVDVERAAMHDLPNRVAKCADRLIVGENQFSPPCHHGKEIATAPNVRPPIITHFKTSDTGVGWISASASTTQALKTVDALRLSTLHVAKPKPWFLLQIYFSARLAGCTGSSPCPRS